VRAVILNTISSEKFHHKLQSGQFQEVLSMISSDPTLLERGFTQEVDVTTHSVSDDRNADRTGYLRTKINLLTGEIHNEVSENLLLDPASYHNLHQLHSERIEASYRIVRGHLDRLKAILTALLPALQQLPAEASTQQSIGMGEFTATLLQNPSTQSYSLSSTAANFDEHEQIAVIDKIALPIERLFPPDESIETSLTTASSELLAAMPVTPGEFDEIDLSIPSDDEIWEEWVEDDDFQPESIAPQPTTVLEELKLPDLQEHWVRRPLSPIDVKPIVPRSTAISSDPIERWEKFVPEYIEIDSSNRTDPHRISPPGDYERLA
jgi:hypothetical protein